MSAIIIPQKPVCEALLTRLGAEVTVEEPTRITESEELLGTPVELIVLEDALIVHGSVLVRVKRVVSTTGVPFVVNVDTFEVT